MKARALWVAFSWCLIAVPGVVTPGDDQVYRWLERMDAAMSQMNYQGTFVYVRGNDVASMRITHVVDERGLHERLVSVSGTPREVIRDAKGVSWFAGENHTILANSAATRTFFPELPLGDQQQAALSYDFRLANNERIAGHATRRVDIVPKDRYRYGYSLWLELQSNLLLQWELTGREGETLAKLMFTELKMGSEVDLAELRRASAGDAAKAAKAAKAPAMDGNNNVSELPVWRPARLPSGFRLTSHRRQNLQQGAPFDHLVYSDGIATVSVYIEAAVPNSELKPGLSKLGTTHVYTRKLDGEFITVLGDVPSATVKLMAESLQSSGR